MPTPNTMLMRKNITVLALEVAVSATLPRKRLDRDRVDRSVEGLEDVCAEDGERERRGPSCRRRLR